MADIQDQPTSEQPTIRIRKRVRPPEPEITFDIGELPEPTPEHTYKSRWPNGSGVYTKGHAGNPLQRLGWTVRQPDGSYRVYRATGPGEADFKEIGTAKTHGEALSKLPDESWGAKVKPPRVRKPVKDQEPEASSADDPADAEEEPAPEPSLS